MTGLLQELTLEKGKLIDKSGKQSDSYTCWVAGENPPEDYQEQLDQQQVEVSKLKKKFTVI